MLQNPLKQWYIYKITNPEGRVYIGRSCRPNDREKYHFVVKHRWNGYKNPILVDSVRRYGKDSHSFEIIDSFFSNVSYANGKEIFWIRTFMSNINKWPNQNGMNRTDGGWSLKGFKHSEESKTKMRKSGATKYFSDSHKKNISEGRKTPIIQYNANGEVVREFSSIKEAYIFFGLKSNESIHRVLRGEKLHFKTFIFKYKNK